MEEDLQKAHIKNVQSFKAHLTGEQEVPNPVDTEATGQTIFKLSKDGSSLSYKLIVANIEMVAAAHIHIGARGTNGGVAVTLYNQPTEGRTSGVLAEGVITDDMVTGYTLAELVDIMLAEGAYVNVHTSQNPGGEIRGQISANN
ncbi:CHRD domain-containing protein [Antarcticibacterium flavum]|uniref:CHRD domain-containing protein n=2 Tax=Flavobacteriaceae TaxID=49546 RepID=A0A5B7X9Q9_9FLAO|nr:CHRD domain protein [Antarcticibacterium sp. W02-3]QCY71341.1 CHRD domain-containing protein [Antarcticibacterium flavum]